MGSGLRPMAKAIWKTCYRPPTVGTPVLYSTGFGFNIRAPGVNWLMEGLAGRSRQWVDGGVWMALATREG
ncbi:MAG TPA: hypothetical protein HPQ00_00610 [Magnetococcales bacterium]|nr:hypothetical protein [Magnetococcales bacterium]